MLQLTWVLLSLIFFEIIVQEVIPDRKADEQLFPPDEKVASSSVDDTHSKHKSIFDKKATRNELYFPNKRCGALMKFCVEDKREDGMNDMTYYTVAKESNGDSSKGVKDLANHRIKENEQSSNNYNNDIWIKQSFHFRNHKQSRKFQNIYSRVNRSPASNDNNISENLGSYTDNIAYGPSPWQHSMMPNYRYKRSVNSNETDTGVMDHNTDVKNMAENIDNSSKIAYEGRKIRQIGFNPGYQRYRYGFFGDRHRPPNYRPTILVTATLNENNKFPTNYNNRESTTKKKGNNNRIKPSSNAQCNPNNNLYYPNSEDCSTYFTCNQGIMVLTHCPRGHYYISERTRCEDSIPEGCKHVIYHVGQHKPIYEE